MFFIEGSLLIWSILSGINIAVLFLSILMFLLSESNHKNNQKNFEHELLNSFKKGEIEKTKYHEVVISSSRGSSK